MTAPLPSTPAAPPSANSYDEVPYHSKAFPQTHPARLATMAKLFGLSPAPVERCRVLELGCASGGNLVDLAWQFPDAQFIGVDLSARQIEDGRRIVDALGLPNLDLRAADILAVDESWGEFDYILCHGVYSWAPAAVREKILQICRTHLAPHGTAYVSYNTNPGWRMRGTIRDVMKFHSAGFDTPKKKVEQARALLEFLAENAADAHFPYARYLAQELEVLSACSDEYIYHEHLEEVNEPVYFYEFAERLDAHDLLFLGEADFVMMATNHFPEHAQKWLLREGTNLIKMEQWMDFLRNRMFRQSLVCRASVQLDRTICPDKVYDLFVSSEIRPADPEPNVREPNVSEAFIVAERMQVESGSPLMKAAFLHLSDTKPLPIAFDELVRAARKRLQYSPNPSANEWRANRAEVGSGLLLAYRSKLVDFHSCSFPIALVPGDLPKVSPVVRLQASRGAIVANLRHETTALNAFDRALVQLLDGTRDRAALIAELAKLVQNRKLKVELGGERVDSGPVLENSLGSALEDSLPKLARRALLLS